MAAPTPHPQPTPEAVASILQQLTTPSTTQLRQAESTLNALLASPNILPPLTQILCTHPQPALRHLASVILRRNIPRHWPSLDNPAQSTIKSSLLPRLSEEPDAAPRRGIVALLAAICRVEDALWPELTATAINLSSHQAAPLRAAAFSVFQALSDAIPTQVAPHLQGIVPILSAGLADPDLAVRLAALHAYDAAISPASVHEGPALDSLAEIVPAVVAVAAGHQQPGTDEFARASCAVFDVLTLVMEIPAGTKVKAYFQDAVMFGLRVLATNDAASAARSAANEFVVGSVQAKPKTLKKTGLALEIVRTACKVVFDNAAHAGAPQTYGHDDDDPDEEEVAAIHLALRLLDACARRPELSRQVFAEVMTIVSRTFEATANAEPAARDAALAAGYRIIGAISQGCSYEVTSHAQEVIKRLVSGAADESAMFSTRGRAIEAVGLACEALDTDEMPDEVTAEVASAALSAILQGMRHGEFFVRKHACMSLEAVITLFKDDTNALRGRVAEIIQAIGAIGLDAAVEAVVALGVLAEHATEAFASSAMYKDVIEGIIRLMSQTAEKDMLSKVAALEAAGSLVSACKDQSVIERLASHAITCLDVDDPSCKHATYSFFARMADAVGGSVVAVFGAKVLLSAMESIQREDVVFVPEDQGDENGGIGNGFGDGDEDDEPGRGTFQVRTALLDEKMVAVACIGAFAAASATDMYIQRVSASMENAAQIRELFSRSVALVEDLTAYFHEDVRAAAHRAHSRVAAANVALSEKHPSFAFAGPDLAHNGLGRLIYGMKEDDDIWVVTNVLNATATYLELVPAEIVNQHKASLLEGIDLLISGEATCQLTAEVEELEGDGFDDDADGDEIGSLLEAVGEVIEAMAHSLRGHFAQDFPNLLKKMLDKLYSKTGSPRNRGMVLGSVAGILLFMNWDRCTKFSPPPSGSPEFELALSTTDDTASALLPIALTAIQSGESKTLQRNAVFLTGIIFSRVRASKSETWNLLPQALNLFQDILSAGNKADGALVDNAAGAVARIMIARGTPAGALGDKKVVLQAILSTVPLQDDPSENTTIARTLVALAQAHFNDLLDQSIFQSVVSCLVSAALMYRQSELMKETGIRHEVTEYDLNDQITGLDKQEMWALVATLTKIRETKGTEAFAKLGLSGEDEIALAKIMQHGNR